MCEQFIDERLITVADQPANIAQTVSKKVMSAKADPQNFYPIELAECTTVDELLDILELCRGMKLCDMMGETLLLELDAINGEFTVVFK